MNVTLHNTSLLSPERTESGVLEGVKLRASRTAAMRQPGQVLHGHWARCSSSPLGVLVLEVPATVLTDGHSGRVSPTID